jgi:predicted transcriptional regulator
MTYRNSNQIAECILQSVSESGAEGIKVTRLLHKSNLSHVRFKRFANKLVQSNLINKIEVKNKTIFIITENGRVYLDEYRRFSSIADSFGLEL